MKQTHNRLKPIKPNARLIRVPTIVKHSGMPIVEIEIWVRHKRSEVLLCRSQGHATDFLTGLMQHIVNNFNSMGSLTNVKEEEILARWRHDQMARQGL